MPWSSWSSRGRARLRDAARAAARRAPDRATILRHHVQPAAIDIARLAGTATFAYLIALLLPGTSRPVLAPLTAMLVLELTIYQTLRNAVKRVASVITGVLVALAVSELVGFTWWSLAATILVALIVGYLLPLGDHLLEVPISAMLVLSVGTTSAAISGRIIDTIVGAGAGMLAGLLVAPLRLEPAERAIDDLWRELAILLERMALSVCAGTFTHAPGDWLQRSRSLSGEIRRVDNVLRKAEESIRLNPRSLWMAGPEIALRHSLETLEHSAITIRGIARALFDSARLVGEQSLLRHPEAGGRLADALLVLAAAIRDYGPLARGCDDPGHVLLDEVEGHLAAASAMQDRLSEILATDPAVRPVGWPQRGELISHLDRLRNELREGVGITEVTLGPPEATGPEATT